MENLTKVNTEKYTLAYRKLGKGPAIVLIHGFPENGELWHKIWDELAANFTVLIPDLPGTGASTFDGDDISIEQLAESIKSMLDAENISKAVIAGHSMGGYTALAFADLYGEYVAGLSLIHSVASADNEEKKQTRKKSIALIQKGGKELFIKQMIPNLFAESYVKNNLGTIKTQVERGMALEAQTMVAFYNAMINRPDRVRILDSADFPVQFVLGADDKVIPLEAGIEQSSIPADKFVSIYKECGHMSMLEKPQDLLNDIKRFGKHCFENNKVTL